MLWEESEQRTAMKTLFLTPKKKIEFDALHPQLCASTFWSTFSLVDVLPIIFFTHILLLFNKMLFVTFEQAACAIYGYAINDQNTEMALQQFEAAGLIPCHLANGDPRHPSAVI